MKMVRVYNGNDSILACHVDLEYYKRIGWSEKAPATKIAKAKADEGAK
jgi:hypothetical protein